MDSWHWLLTICRVAIPPGFAIDMRRVEQLEAQRQRDPQATVPLIPVYERIVGRLQPDEAPIFYAFIQTSLGNAYIQLPSGDQAAHLEQAIACFQQALRLLTPQAAPRDYAMTQTNLGVAYLELPTGDRAVHLEQAIACFQQALRFYTPEAAPRDYARTQTNLGVAYSELPSGERAAHLEQAIACYHQALRFLTPEAAPSECGITNNALADLYFTQGEWKAALGAYRAAMDAGERLYRAGLSMESKARQVATNIDLYRNAAFTAVRCGQVAEALLILEQGKTRLLAEALHWRVARPPKVPDKTWREFEQTGAAVRAAQAGTAAMPSQDRDVVQAYAAREQAARQANAALERAIEQVRLSAPQFLQPIDLPTIQGLLAEEQTVLVTFCITPQGSLGFVVSQEHDHPVRVAELPTLTQAQLRRLFIESDAQGRAVGGWLGAYIRYLGGPTPVTFAAWQTMITRVLAEVGQRLLAPTFSVLPAGVRRITFLPSAELFLLPLHAAPLSENDSPLVCDRYQVSYAPSVQVLADIRAKASQQVAPDLYATINPQADPELVFTLSEGVAITRLFTRPLVDEGPIGTKQRVIAGVRGRGYVHFSCHGNYDWNDPTHAGLELADGRLTLAELQQGVIDLSAARLVTLSACETGISDVLQGSAEEYVGVPAGFLQAGVPCVVSSLWAVPDISTALLMERFYRNHVTEGMDIAAALQEAQKWVRELNVQAVAQYAEQSHRDAPGKKKDALLRWVYHYRHMAQQDPTWCPFAHPYYWAAFTVSGL